MKIHPAADVFPMMTKDELQELAADIAANGLIHPIIIDDQNQLIDGRNRAAACKIAGIEPQFDKLNGRDPLDYIVSANLARRNLTKGQQAMALAMIYPEAAKGGRGKKNEARNLTETVKFSYTRLNQARSVLRQSSDLAKSVMAGSISLDEALEKVEELKQQANSAEAQLVRLRSTAPDLATRVTEENLTLAEALAILDDREAESRRVRKAGREAAEELFTFAGNVGSILTAIAQGEDIRIPAKTMKTIDDAYQMLKAEMSRSK